MRKTSVSYINLFDGSELKELVAWQLQLQGVQHVGYLADGCSTLEQPQYEARVDFIIDNGDTASETRAKIQEEAFKATTALIVGVTGSAGVLIFDITVNAAEVSSSLGEGVRVECVVWFKEVRQASCRLPKTTKKDMRSKVIAQWYESAKPEKGGA